MGTIRGLTSISFKWKLLILKQIIKKNTSFCSLHSQQQAWMYNIHSGVKYPTTIRAWMQWARKDTADNKREGNLKCG